MSHVNATVPRSRQINEWREYILQKTELEFWRDRAREYADELENIFDHASETGHIEIWRGSEKIDLYTKTNTQERVEPTSPDDRSYGRGVSDERYFNDPGKE